MEDDNKFSIQINRDIPPEYLEREIEHAQYVLSRRLCDILKTGDFYSVKLITEHNVREVRLDMHIGKVKELKYIPKFPPKMGIWERLVTCARILKSGYVPIHYDIN